MTASDFSCHLRVPYIILLKFLIQIRKLYTDQVIKFVNEMSFKICAIDFFHHLKFRVQILFLTQTYLTCMTETNRNNEVCDLLQRRGCWNILCLQRSRESYCINTINIWKREFVHWDKFILHSYYCTSSDALEFCVGVRSFNFSSSSRLLKALYTAFEDTPYLYAIKN